EIDHGERRVGATVARVKLDGLLQVGNGLGVVVWRGAPVVLPPTKESLIGSRHGCLLLTRGLLSRSRQSERQRISDAAGYLVLQSKDIGERNFVAIRPDMTAGGGVDALRLDAGPLSCPVESSCDARVGGTTLPL